MQRNTKREAADNGNEEISHSATAVNHNAERMSERPPRRGRYTEGAADEEIKEEKRITQVRETARGGGPSWKNRRDRRLTGERKWASGGERERPR